MPLPATPVSRARLFAALAYLLALTFAASLGFGLSRMPVQVSDSLDEILAVSRAPSAYAVFRTALRDDRAHLRALRAAQTKVLVDVARGHYRLVFRGFHVALLVACLLLFTRALQVRTGTDLAAAAFALTVLIGLHTFAGGLREAFPINHFLEVGVCCLVVLNLAQSQGGAWVDVLAALTFVAASLTLESGLLVWVVAVAARAAGLKGISWRGIALMTALLAGYMYLRLVYLAIASPAVGEREAGFWLGSLSAEEQRVRFADRPALFFGYNVGSALLSLLFSEPRAGVFVGVRSWLAGDVLPRVWIAIGSSLLTTGLIAAVGLRALRRDSGVARTDKRLLGLCAVVIAANAAFTYAYVKDEILFPAGVFYALSGFVALRHALTSAHRRLVLTAVLSAALLITSVGWAVRTAGVHHVLRSQAFKQRNDWVQLPAAWQRRGRWPADAASQALVRQLRQDALSVPAPNPQLDPRWVSEIWTD